MAQGKLFQAVTGGAFDIDGQPVILNPGDVAREGHPVMYGRQHMFVPFVVRFELPDEGKPPVIEANPPERTAPEKTAEPERPRPVAADTQKASTAPSRQGGARTR